MKQASEIWQRVDDSGSTWRRLVSGVALFAVALLAAACSPSVVGSYDRAFKAPMFGPSSRTTPVTETNRWKALNRHDETLTFEFKDGSPRWVTSITHDETSYPLWQHFRRSVNARYLFVPYIHIEPTGPRYELIEVDTVNRTEDRSSVSGKVAKKYLWRR